MVEWWSLARKADVPVHHCRHGNREPLCCPQLDLSFDLIVVAYLDRTQVIPDKFPRWLPKTTAGLQHSDEDFRLVRGCSVVLHRPMEYHHLAGQYLRQVLHACCIRTSL